VVAVIVANKGWVFAASAAVGLPVSTPAAETVILEGRPVLVKVRAPPPEKPLVREDVKALPTTSSSLKE